MGEKTDEPRRVKIEDGQVGIEGASKEKRRAREIVGKEG